MGLKECRMLSILKSCRKMLYMAPLILRHANGRTACLHRCFEESSTMLGEKARKDTGLFLMVMLTRSGWRISTGTSISLITNPISVLDDNKMLTLPNGERLNLPPSVRIMFEVETLKYATP